MPAPPRRFLCPLVVSFSLAVGMAALAESGDERSDLEEILDDIGLFEATIDTDSLVRGESGVDDPPADVLEEDEDRDGQPDEPRGEPFVAPIPFRSPPTVGPASIER